MHTTNTAYYYSLCTLHIKLFLDLNDLYRYSMSQTVFY